MDEKELIFIANIVNNYNQLTIYIRNNLIIGVDCKEPIHHE
ncbi:hypothetical protein [Listeria fleischmannii]|nr:hypothetical protein [Listeria fleischmannii]